MFPIEKNKKYFISDTELKSKTEDKFKHKDLADNIISIIENTDAPFNIAVVGKWGLGKSSLINMVKEHLSVHEGSYIIEDINAWKYEKEAMKRVLLRKVLASIGYKDKDAFNELLDRLTRYTAKIIRQPKKFCEIIKTELIPLVVSAFAIYVVGILLAVIGHLIMGQINQVDFSTNALLSFILTSFVSNFYIPIIIVLFQKYINTSSGRSTFNLAPPITQTDEYERILESKLNDPKLKDKKIVIVVDDLDRLTPNKIVEALDAIKAFVGYPNFIFIVPFDDSILKNAIQQNKTTFSNNEHLAIESDLFLDKLFQYRVHLPNVIQSNIPNYAIELTKQEAPALVALCEENIFAQICKEILIHKKVITPRQAKKIINTFSNNLLVAYRRENGGVEPDTFTSIEGIKMIAKISVLQADFPSFYAKLFETPDLIDQFLTTVKGDYTNGIHPLFAMYFEERMAEENSASEISYQLNSVGQNLYMFLTRTASVTCNELLRFLYLDDDQLSMIFGSTFSRSTRDAITSGAYEIAISNIESEPDKAIDTLLYEIVTNCDPVEYVFCAIGVINLSRYGNVIKHVRLMNQVDAKLQSVAQSNISIDCAPLNMECALKVSHSYPHLTHIDSIVCKKLTDDFSNIIDSMEVFFAHESIASTAVKNTMARLISDIGNAEKSKLAAEDLFEIEGLDIAENYKIYFSDIGMFDRLAAFLIKNKHFGPNFLTFDRFLVLLQMHISTDTDEEGLKIIVPYLKDADAAEVLMPILLKCITRYKTSTTTNEMLINLMNTNRPSLYSDINKLLAEIYLEFAEDSAKVVDAYMAANLDAENIDELLNMVFNSQASNMLEQTILKIHSNLLEQRILPSTVIHMQTLYTSTQNIALMEALKPAFAHNTFTEESADYACEILSSLSEHHENYEYVTIIASHIYAQLGRSSDKMIASIERCQVFYDGITDEVKKQFVTWASANINGHAKVAIYIYDVFFGSIAKPDYPKIASTIMSVSPPDEIDITMRLLRALRGEFKQGTSQITEYLDFLYKRLSDDIYRKDAIIDIYNHYAAIGNLEKFTLLAVKYPDVSSEAIDSLNKFTKNYGYDEKRSLSQKTIENCEKAELVNLNKIFETWLGETYATMLEEICANLTEDDSIIYIDKLMHLTFLRTDITNKTKISILLLLLASADNSALPEILSQCKGIKRISDNEDKRAVGNALYESFRSTILEDLKYQIVTMTKILGIRASFEKDANNTNRNFSDEEMNILKQKSSK